MKALVTGAKGMLGQDLCPILEDEGFDVIETDIENLDITKDCTKFLEKEKPDYVFHCAAFTNVDKAETDLKIAELINTKGTENIAQACSKIGSIMIYISTDYVFSGEKQEPYLPEDLTAPINNYGITKLKGEEAVIKYCEEYYIIRTSWLYGHYGKNLVETMLDLARVQSENNCQNNIKVVNDQIGSPTWTVDLANGLIKILDKPYGIYHICGDGQTSWYEFAKEIFSQTGIKVNLTPCTTNEFPRPAKRPKFSVLKGEKTRSWKLALRDYLMLREEDL